MRSRPVVVAMLLLFAACGREGSWVTLAASPTPTARPTATPRATPTPAPDPSPSPSPSPEATSTPEACRNSTSAGCGVFRFDPAVGSDEPIEVSVTYSPPSPKAGDTVTFTLVAADPDSRLVSLGTYRFARGGPGAVGSDPRGDCPRAYGPWDPPDTSRGTERRTLTHTYREAGTYEALFTFFSRSYSPDDHPWPDRPPGDENGRCIDPLASSGRTTVTVEVGE